MRKSPWDETPSYRSIPDISVLRKPSRILTCFICIVDSYNSTKSYSVWKYANSSRSKAYGQLPNNETWMADCVESSLAILSISIPSKISQWMLHTATEFNLVCVIVLRRHVFSRLKLLNDLNALHNITELTSIRRRLLTSHPLVKKV